MNDLPYMLNVFSVLKQDETTEILSMAKLWLILCQKNILNQLYKDKYEYLLNN